MSAAAHLEHDGVAYQVLAEVAEFGFYWLPVWRRSLYYTEVACTHQRELQGARYGGGGEGEAVYAYLHLLQFLLYADAELLLFVYDEQAEVFELQLFVGYGVGADKDINLAIGHILVNLCLLFGGAEAVQVVHTDRHPFQALAEGVVVLEGQHRRRHKHGDLLVVAAGLEGSAYCHLGLAETHIAAHQAVHGIRLFHVVLHGHRGLQLVGRVLVDERGFQFGLHRAVAAEGKTT